MDEVGKDMTDAPENLLPCPFCGEPAKAQKHNGTTQATCSAKHVDCGGTDVLVPVSMWNTRTDVTDARIKELAVTLQKERFAKWTLVESPLKNRIAELEAKVSFAESFLQGCIGLSAYSAADGFAKPHETEQSRQARVALAALKAKT
jgi:hypothetical protein